MATNWKVLIGTDIRKVIDARSQLEGNQNLADDVVDGAALDPSAANRRDELVAVAVDEVRAAVRNGGRVGLSLTADSIPPEAEWHTLVLAAYRLVSSTPGLSRSLMTGDGERKAPLERMYDEAVAYVWGDRARGRLGLTGGDNCTEPSDPMGRDYATAVDEDEDSASYNPSVSAVRYGSVSEDTEADLKSYGPVTEGL